MNHQFSSSFVWRVPSSLLTLAVAVVWSGLMGCSTVRSPDEFLIPPDMPRLESPVLDYRVGIVPLAIDESFRQRVQSVNGVSGNRRHVAIPSDGVRETFVAELAAAMRQTGACAEVHVFGDADTGRDGDFDRVLREAWDAGLDVVIRPVLRTHDCQYMGQTDAYVPTVILWLGVMQFFTWGIADEKFAADVGVSVEVYSTAGLRKSPVAVREIETRVEHALDDFQQGFNLFNVFITPAGLSDGHWADIGTTLLPLARQSAQREILAATMNRESGLAAALANASATLSKTMVICCGATRAGVLARQFVTQDIHAIRDALTNEALQPICDPRALAVLTGKQATRAAFEATLDANFTRRLRQGDRAILVLAADGTIDAQGRAWLHFADGEYHVWGDNDLAKTALALDDLVTRLAKLPASCALILAVHWSEFDSASASAPTSTHIAQMTEQPPNVVILSANRFPQQILEIEQLQGSLFADQLARTLKDAGETDANGDSQLSWAEIAARVCGPVETLSQIEGTLQSTGFSGPDALTTAPVFTLAAER